MTNDALSSADALIQSMFPDAQLHHHSSDSGQGARRSDRRQRQECVPSVPVSRERAPFFPSPNTEELTFALLSLLARTRRDPSRYPLRWRPRPARLRPRSGHPPRSRRYPGRSRRGLLVPREWRPEWIRQWTHARCYRRTGYLRVDLEWWCTGFRGIRSFILQKNQYRLHPPVFLARDFRQEIFVDQASQRIKGKERARRKALVMRRQENFDQHQTYG